MESFFSPQTSSTDTFGLKFHCYKATGAIISSRQLPCQVYQVLMGHLSELKLSFSFIVQILERVVQNLVEHRCLSLFQIVSSSPSFEDNRLLLQYRSLLFQIPCPFGVLHPIGLCLYVRKIQELGIVFNLDLSFIVFFFFRSLCKKST